MSAVAAQKEKVVAGHPIDQMLRHDRLPHILCPGCGIGPVVHCYAESILESGRHEDEHVCVSGIGCSGRAAGYINVDSYHTTHGRAIPFALGIAVQNPELVVTVISGDGDLTAIGGNHFIHAARRNVDLNIICINNFNYGMTGGQAAPTTPTGATASTTPYGNTEPAFNLSYLARAVGASFVARWSIFHVRQLKEAILRTMEIRGFTFIEVLSPCPTGFGRANKLSRGLSMMEAFRDRCQVENGAPQIGPLTVDITDTSKPIVLGNFLDEEREPYGPVVMGPVTKRGPAEWAAVRKTRYDDERHA